MALFVYSKEFQLDRQTISIFVSHIFTLLHQASKYFLPSPSPAHTHTHKYGGTYTCCIEHASSHHQIGRNMYYVEKKKYNNRTTGKSGEWSILYKLNCDTDPKPFILWCK